VNCARRGGGISRGRPEKSVLFRGFRNGERGEQKKTVFKFSKGLGAGASILKKKKKKKKKKPTFPLPRTAEGD